MATTFFRKSNGRNGCSKQQHPWQFEDYGEVLFVGIHSNLHKRCLTAPKYDPAVRKTGVEK
jgi:hypothetical protein